MHHANHTTIHGILALLLLWLPAAVMAAPVNDSFDHFSTGFSLTGGHRTVECDACHTTGTFAGTARECATCHSALMNTGAVVKSGFHIQSSNQCDACHSTLAWDDVRRVNHMSVLGDCRSCHLTDVPGTHVPILAGDDCITCHRTSSWVAMHYNHSGAGADCISCHGSGSSRATKPPTSDGLHNYGANVGKQCNSCHSTRAWSPASYTHLTGNYPNHSFTRLGCSSCHSGGPYSALVGATCLTCHTNDAREEHNPSSINPDCTSCHEHTNALSRGKW